MSSAREHRGRPWSQQCELCKEDRFEALLRHVLLNTQTRKSSLSCKTKGPFRDGVFLPLWALYWRPWCPLGLLVASGSPRCPGFRPPHASLPMEPNFLLSRRITRPCAGSEEVGPRQRGVGGTGYCRASVPLRQGDTPPALPGQHGGPPAAAAGGCVQDHGGL